MEELGAADVGVGDRWGLGPRFGPATVEAVLQDRFHRGQGACVDRQRPVAGGLKPLRAVAAGQPQDAEAGAEALLGVRSVAQDDVDEDGGGGSDAAGALAQHLRRRMLMESVAGSPWCAHRSAPVALRLEDAHAGDFARGARISPETTQPCGRMTTRVSEPKDARPVKPIDLRRPAIR